MHGFKTKRKSFLKYVHHDYYNIDQIQDRDIFQLLANQFVPKTND